MITDELEKATVLNKYFFSNFNHAYSSANYSWFDTALAPSTSTSTIPEEYLCSDDQILGLLPSLKTRKATGADGITAQMLKATGTSIVKSITKLFNLSLKTSIFPAYWKFARVVPIPKTGNPESPSNYRPISILPIISKLLEKHVHNLLYQHLSNNCPLSPNQWGFTEGKLTTTALLSFVHECQEALDNGGEVCSVFFDLCKAFDSVPHQPLLCKLFYLQVNPFLLRWIHSYLSSRTQSAVLDGAQSDPLPVVSGVPQGSVLGPLLFLVYIDGASNTVLHGKIAMYADDIALYSIIKNPSDYTYLQRDITSLCSWLAINHLTLNLTKCCYMLFSRKHQQTLPDTDLYVGNTHVLARVDHYKYLGLNFSTDLSWSHHVGLICKKTRKLVGMLYRNFYQFSSSNILVKLYKSLIRPHMEYACQVWDPHLKKDIQVLENVQKFALRVCSKSWSSDYATLLDTLSMPTLSDRRETLKLCLLFNILTGKVIYPSCPITVKNSPYTTRCSNTLQLVVPRARSNQYKHSFLPSAIQRWNGLNFAANACNSLTSFKYALLYY